MNRQRSLAPKHPYARTRTRTPWSDSKTVTLRVIQQMYADPSERVRPNGSGEFS